MSRRRVPWGNKLLIHEAGSFGRMQLGMPYVEFDVPSGSAKAIADFYRKVFETPASVDENGRHAGGARFGRPLAGAGVPRDQVEARGLLTAITSRSTSPTSRGRTSACSSGTSITEESNQYQYRFVDITDLESGKPLFQIEHEVRCMTHPLYARPLVNRNPAQTNRNYVPGRDAWVAEPMELGDGRSAHGHAGTAVRGG